MNLPRSYAYECGPFLCNNRQQMANMLARWRNQCKYGREVGDLMRQLSKLRRQGKRRRIHALVDEMASASKRNDTKEVFRLSLILSARALGPKRRDLAQAQPEKPTWQDWNQHVSKPGAEGGWSATLVDPDKEDEMRQAWQKRGDPEIDPNNTMETMSTQGLLKELHRMKKGRAVPEHSCPKEI